MHVGVIGAGLTGLATVHELRQREVSVTCFEAAPRPGGVIGSTRLDGTIVEHGPQRLRLGDLVRTYLERLGLDDAVRTAPASAPIFVHRDGALREVPFDLSTAIRTDALSWRGKLRLLKEPFTDGARPTESAADYFRRKLGPEAYRALLEPLVGGIYAADPAAMPAKVALGPLLAAEERRGSLTRVAVDRVTGDADRPPAAVPEEGMAALPKSLAGRHESAIHLSEPVTRIEASHDGVRIETDQRSIECTHAVVATDAPSAAAVLASTAPQVSETLRSLRYNPLAMVYLRAPIDREGLGYQVCRDSPLRTLGVSWNGRAFDRDELVTAFMGGMNDPSILEHSDRDIAEIAAAELEEVMGVPADVLGVYRVEPGVPSYDDSWLALDGVNRPPHTYLVGNYTDRLGIAGRLRQGRRVARAIAEEATAPVARLLP